MPKQSYGEIPKSRARRLLKVLLDYANFGDEDGREIKGFECRFITKNNDTSYIYVEGTLKIFLNLINKNKDLEPFKKEQVREAIHLLGRKYLNILIDEREGNSHNFTGKNKGIKLWKFYIKLFTDRNTEHNLEQFDKLWNKKHPNNQNKSNSIVRQSEINSPSITLNSQSLYQREKYTQPEISNVVGNFHDKVIKTINKFININLQRFSQSNNLSFSSSQSFLEQNLTIFRIGKEKFRSILNFDIMSAELLISIEDLINLGNKPYSTTTYIKHPGKIKSIRIVLTSNLQLDFELLCDEIAKKINNLYKNTLVDYKSALGNYCYMSGGDYLYDIIRKSDIPEELRFFYLIYRCIDSCK